MADTERKACYNSQQESNTPAGNGRVSVRLGRQGSSPRAFLAFSALAAVDWIRERFDRLASRIISLRASHDARSQAKPEVLPETHGPGLQCSVAGPPSTRSGQQQVERAVQ